MPNFQTQLVRKKEARLARQEFEWRNMWEPKCFELSDYSDMM